MMERFLAEVVVGADQVLLICGCPSNLDIGTFFAERQLVRNFVRRRPIASENTKIALSYREGRNKNSE